MNAFAENSDFVGFSSLRPAPEADFADAISTQVEDEILATYGIGQSGPHKTESYAVDVVLAVSEAQTELDDLTATDTTKRPIPSGTTLLRVARVKKPQQEVVHEEDQEPEAREEREEPRSPFNPELIKFRLDEDTLDMLPVIPSTSIIKLADGLDISKDYKSPNSGVLKDKSMGQHDYNRVLAFRLATQLNDRLPQELQDRLLVRYEFNESFSLDVKVLEELLAGLKYGERISTEIGYMEHALLEELAANVYA